MLYVLNDLLNYRNVTVYGATKNNIALIIVQYFTAKFHLELSKNKIFGNHSDGETELVRVIKRSSEKQTTISYVFET